MERTWEKYLRPKLRGALKKWTSETGGGDGSPPSFQNYCGNEKWLCWVYLLDAENGFLLSANVDPNVHVELDNESGRPSLQPHHGGGSKSNSAKERALATLISIDKCREQITSVLDEASEYMKARMAPPTTTPAKRSIIDILEEEAKLKASGERLAADDLYSPNTKNDMLNVVQEKRRSLAKEISRMQSDDT
jgi:hypothetical protein